MIHLPLCRGPTQLEFSQSICYKLLCLHFIPVGLMRKLNLRGVTDESVRNLTLGVKQPNPKARSYHSTQLPLSHQEAASRTTSPPHPCLHPQLILHSVVSWGSFKSIPSLNHCKEFLANPSRVSCGSRFFPRLVESLRLQKSRCLANPSVAILPEARGHTSFSLGLYAKPPFGYNSYPRILY